ncbi:MAG TPA: hypothetical protein VFI34_01725 [Candidatus Limnocylindrales bacterium]|nr:hypothetical protein [Candidatus Limnocylindrales bacterium]
MAVAPRSWTAEPPSVPGPNEPEPAELEAVAAGAGSPAGSAASPADLHGAAAMPTHASDDEPREPSIFEDPILADGPSLDPVDPGLPPPPDVLPEVQWPGAADGNRETLSWPAPVPAPPVRQPAGAWLPPSALLTALDEDAVTTAGAGAAAAGVLPAPTAGLGSRDWLAVFGSADRRWAAARRAIAIGSAITLIGFVLPWANGSAGSLLNVWTSVWGLAGAGHWLVVLAVAALGIAAASTGRAAAIPLALPAIALGSFVLGLIWPTLLGAASRPIGILVVLVGTVALLVGGVIHLDARHEAATPDV